MPERQETLGIPDAASSHLPDILKFAETDRYGVSRNCPRAAAACKPVKITSVTNIPVPDETTSTNGTLLSRADPATASCVQLDAQGAVTIKVSHKPYPKIEDDSWGYAVIPSKRAGSTRLVCAICRSQKALPTIPVCSRQILFGYPRRSFTIATPCLCLHCQPVFCRDIKEPDSGGQEVTHLCF
jgi:hypothetical protein